MRPFERVQAIAVPMPDADINTDQIVPGRFMHKPRQDYGRYCFHDLRFDPLGVPINDFVLNRREFASGSILVAGPNFGCGSSREHAVFTLVDYGIRAILAPSFGDIFFINCFKNGLLPVVLPEAFIFDLLVEIQQSPGCEITVDLPSQQVTTASGHTGPFEINDFYKECLLKGLDEVEFTLTLCTAIERFERNHQLLSIIESETSN